MFSKEITIEELAQGIYIAGIAQYNKFVDWFEKKGIKINSKKMMFITGLINEKIFEKILKDEKFKLEGNLSDEIIKKLNDTIPLIELQEIRENVEEYIQVSNNKIENILKKDNSDHLDIINYFLSEILFPPIDLDGINRRLSIEFIEWECDCQDLIRKFKVN